MKILVVAAHPDDEILGMGGTISHHIEKGDSVSILILSQGVLSRKLDIEMNQRMVVENIESAQRASEVLGVRNLRIEEFPDQQFDKVPFLDLAIAVSEHVQKSQPDLVYTHWNRDLNLDHRLTSEATLVACRPIPGQSVRDLYFFETLSSSEWAFESAFSPNVFVNIESHMKKKLAAMSCYSSELRAFPHPRSLEGIEALARFRGVQSGLRAAEAFKLVRSLRE